MLGASRARTHFGVLTVLVLAFCGGEELEALIG